MTNGNNWNLLNVCVCPHRALALAHKRLLKLVNLVQLLVALYVVAVFVVAVVLASGAMQMVIFIASMCLCLHMHFVEPSIRGVNGDCVCTLVVNSS